MQAHLGRVIAAHEHHQQARQRLLDTIAEAVADGVPMQPLADVLGITRVTLWRWLQDREATAEPNISPPRR